MATSVVSIWNLALAKLGAGRVSSQDEDSVQQRECNACYDHLRDTELRQRAWIFAIKRASLPQSATQPAFGFDAAYPLPADCLRPLLPQRTYLDWQLEQIDGAPAILTNDGAPLDIRYIAQVTDPTRFDEHFVEMLACKMAEHMCEALTQSSAKKEAAREDYRVARNLARQLNAYAKQPTDPPEDAWVAARRGAVGSGSNAPWLSRQNG